MQTLFETLRHETAAAHARLEASLALLDGPPARDRFTAVLAAFHGFHRVWEPAIAKTVGQAWFAPRRRLAHLEADLAALGLAPNEIAALPDSPGAAALAQGAGAIGSLYVMEGSTLGGQVISRALAAAPWAPPGGLAYFQPYGRETGRMWRELRDWAQAQDTAETRRATINAANATFAMLERWLPAAAFVPAQPGLHRRA